MPQNNMSLMRGKTIKKAPWVLDVEKKTQFNYIYENPKCGVDEPATSRTSFSTQSGDQHAND